MLSVENLGKKFCRSLHRTMLYGVRDSWLNIAGIPLRSDVLRRAEFWALQQVSFELQQGECLGVIGANGAGKSSLLKILNGIIRPDMGRVRVRGRVGALIEVGAGFHPMLTGRENIYVNGQIMGMRKKEIDKKFHDIVEFAEIGEFLDTPVKFYSSGMYVRLGFAVAIHTEPDILLIDEVLAVGDARFRLKCLSAIRRLTEEGICMLFVSHNMSQVAEICQEVLWLQKGRAERVGPSNETIHAYENAQCQTECEIPPPLDCAYGARVEAFFVEPGQDDRKGAPTFCIRYECRRACETLYAVYGIRDMGGRLIYGERIDVSAHAMKGHHEVIISLEKVHLLPGLYMASCGLNRTMAWGDHVHHLPHAATFSVSDIHAPRKGGVVDLSPTIRMT